MKPTAINMIQSASQTSRRDNQRAVSGDGDAFARALNHEIAQKQTSREHQAAQSVSRDNTDNEPTDKGENETRSASQAALLASFWFVFGPQWQDHIAADASGGASEQMPNTSQAMETLSGLISGQLDSSDLSAMQNNQLASLSQLLADSNMQGLTADSLLSSDASQDFAQLLPTLEALLDAQITSQTTLTETLSAGQTEKIAAMAEALAAHAAGGRSNSSQASGMSHDNAAAAALTADLLAGMTLVQTLQSEQNGLTDSVEAVNLAAVTADQESEHVIDDAAALVAEEELAGKDNSPINGAANQANSTTMADSQTAFSQTHDAALSPDNMNQSTLSLQGTDTTTDRAGEALPSAYALAAAEFGQQEQMLQVPGQAVASILALTRGQQQEIRVRLYPDHLGEMHISLIQDGEGLSARIAADTLAACRLLEANLPQLQQALQERQIQCRSIDVQYQPAENSQSYHAADTNQQQGQHAQYGRQAGTAGQTGHETDQPDQPVSAAETAAAAIAKDHQGRINQIIW